MWLQDEYEGYQGKYWSLPPRKILPKPYGKAHPAMWYAAGNTSSYAMAARKGLGVLGFSRADAPTWSRCWRRTRRAIANAEPIGAFVNDNIMVTSTGVSSPKTPTRPRRDAVDARPAPTSSATSSATTTRSRAPTGPAVARALPEPDDDIAARLDRQERAIVGDPDHALAAVPALGERRRRPAGVRDAARTPSKDTLETIRLIGEHVIPKIDTDPVHRTTRFREAAS